MPDKTHIETAAKNSRPDSFEIYDFTSVVPTLCINQPSIFHFDYSLIWIQQGKGKVIIDSQAFSIGPNVLYCLRPGQQSRLSPAASGVGFVVGFSRDFLDLHDTITTDLMQASFFNHFLVTPVVNLKGDAVRFMHHLATKMMDEYSGNSAFKNEMLKGLLKIFVIYTIRATYKMEHPPIISRKINLVQHFHLLLEKYFDSKKLVRDYAEMLHVSAGYLNDAVREISGAAASSHIQQRVIREAKRRILFHGSSMKGVAFLLGFSDQAHFSKYFKNVSGRKFTDFKKEITS